MLPEVPSIRAAIEEEAALREPAFLGAPFLVCGLPLEPLTLRRYLLLITAQSPFVTGGATTPEEAARFLWCLSARHNGAKVGLEEFLAEVAQLNYGEVLEGIAEFLRYSFFDAPADGTEKRESVSYYSFATVYVDIFAKEYGWSYEDCMTTPLPVIFQLLRRITQRNDSKEILFNPLSDPAKARWLESLNAPAVTPNV